MKRHKYISGWCQNGFHVNATHDVFGDSIRCHGEYAGTKCGCECHQTCPSCGQRLPQDDPNEGAA